MAKQKYLFPQIMSKLEISICFIIWMSSVVFASYKIFYLGKQFDFSQYGDDFNDGWFFGYKKDQADYEWDYWTPVMRMLMPWFIIHIILSEFTRLILIEALPVCYVVVTNLILFQFLGIKVVVIGFLKIVLHFLVLKTRSVVLVWILNTSSLLFLSYGIPLFADVLDPKDGDFGIIYYHTILSLSWLQLKCASFSFEYLRKPTQSLGFNMFLSLLGYSYYLPLYFFGPIMLYDEYEKGVKRKFQTWSLSRFSSSVFNILRYVTYVILLDVFLHFFYIHALEYNLEKVKSAGAWYLLGLGYLLAAFFYFKYLAVYGLMRSLATIELYNPPPAPKCVFYIYKNSQTWRTFDVGYYQFIKRYIYVPLLGDEKSLLKRFFAAAVTFSYVYIWHGTFVNFFWWSLFNFVEVSIIESLLTEITKNERFQNWVNCNISDVNKIRLTALILSPLYVFFVIANSYFFVINGGSIFFKQLVEGGWLVVLSTIVFGYSFCITGIYVSEIQEQNMINVKLK